MDRYNWIEVFIYSGFIIVGALLYILLMKYGIPWYYCTYYAVCL